MNRREFTLKISQLILEMCAKGEQPIFDYLLRSTEEQQRLFGIGRTMIGSGVWVDGNSARIVTKCDGVTRISAHQKGIAADIYLTELDAAGEFKRILFDWPEDKAVLWHKRWEEMGGKPVLTDSTGKPWDLGHFEG